MELMERTELKARTRLGQKGRVVIPAPMREALGMDTGGVLDLRVVDGELRISTRENRLRRAHRGRAASPRFHHGARIPLRSRG